VEAQYPNMHNMKSVENRAANAVHNMPDTSYELGCTGRVVNSGSQNVRA